MTRELAFLLLAAPAGLVLGLAFFAGLRTEAVRLAGGSASPLAQIGRRAARLLAAVAVFGAAAKAGAPVLFVAVAAFHVGGAAVLLRAVKAPGTAA